MRKIWLAAAAAALLTMGAAQAQDKVVKIYNWSDYIDPRRARRTSPRRPASRSSTTSTTATTCSRPSCSPATPATTSWCRPAYFLARQIQAGIFQPLDKSKLPNWSEPRPQADGAGGPVRPGQRPRHDLHVGHHRARLQCRQGQGAHARRAAQFLGAAVRSGGRVRSSPTAASWCSIRA